MAKPGDQAAPLLPPPPPPTPPHYQPPPHLLLPVHTLRRRRRCCCGRLSLSSTLLTSALAILLLAIALFLLFPSEPHLHVVRIHLDRFHISTHPAVSLDISLALKVRVRNPDFFALDYSSVVISVGYRGRRLGFVTSDGGHVRARGVSYIDAELRLDGIQVLHDAFYLIEDLVKGSIPFDTVTEIEGKLHVLLVDIPIQGRIACAVYVNPSNATIINQDCYSE